MQYKTIILQLLQQRPEMYNQLRQERKLLQTMEHYASQLKARHEAWKELLLQAKPGSESSQIASAAMEIALKEMETYLLSDSDDPQPLSLEEAITFILHPTPPE